MSYVTRDHLEAGIRRYLDAYPELRTYDGRYDKPIRVYRDGGVLMIESQGRAEPLVEASTELLHEAWIGAGEPDGGVPLVPDKLDVVDVGPVTGIALGSSGADKPGFPGAKAVGTMREGETFGAFVDRAAREAGKAEPGELPAHLDPRRNPFILGSTAPRPAQKTEEDPDAKYLDPARNPFIKIDPSAPPAASDKPPENKYVDPKRNPLIRI
jgi:hypothetical protein